MKVIKCMVRLYPKSWRKRYQEEFIAMLEQYDKPRFTDILDIVFGAIDAHIQTKLQNKKSMQPNSIKGGIDCMTTDDNLDKAVAQKTFQEYVNRHQLPIVFHDVKFDEKSILTFYFFADERVDLLPLAKDMAGVYKQRLQYKQVGRLKHKEQARNYILPNN